MRGFAGWLFPAAVAPGGGAARGDRWPSRAARGATGTCRLTPAAAATPVVDRRQRPPGTRGRPRGLARVMGHVVAGRALRRPHLAQEPDVHRGGGDHARPGIGVNTGIVTVVNAMLFRDLSAPRAHQLVSVPRQSRRAGSGGQETFSTRPSTSPIAQRRERWGCGMGQRQGRSDARWRRAAQAPRLLVSCNYFGRAAAAAGAGRAFRRVRREPGADLVVVLDHYLWHTAFAPTPEWWAGHSTEPAAV